MFTVQGVRRIHLNSHQNRSKTQNQLNRLDNPTGCVVIKSGHK